MNRQTFMKRHGLPVLGHGVGLRRSFFDSITQTERRIDWLEIVPENYVGFGGLPRRVLGQVSERWPVLPHSVSLSVGGPDPLDTDLVRSIAGLMRVVGARWFSDHLCFSGAHGAAFHDLIPLPHSEEAVRHVVPRIREIADRSELPFLVENVSSYALMPGGTMSEAAFLTAVLEEADCGLLLDVNNVYVNAHNHGFDAREFIDAIPLDRVVQVHLAGHRAEGDLLIDDHGSEVSDPVWDLYEYVVQRTGPVSTLVEWDNRIPPLDVVLDVADRARALANEAQEKRRQAA